MEARPAKSQYRRNLPHFQPDECTLFVTFRTYHGLILPEHVRITVLQHCLHDDGSKLWMHAAVVMPDHAHLIFTPLTDGFGGRFGLAEIMSGIKGASAHTVNKLLGQRGHVWQDESFDHMLRRDESLVEKVNYVSLNPVRKGLVARPEDYPWLWREDWHRK